MTKAPEPSAHLKVRVVPGSSRDGIAGWLGDALTIKVTATPDKGRAEALAEGAERMNYQEFAMTLQEATDLAQKMHRTTLYPVHRQVFSEIVETVIRR
jgi:hypothetical protein